MKGHHAAYSAHNGTSIMSTSMHYDDEQHSQQRAVKAWVLDEPARETRCIQSFFLPPGSLYHPDIALTSKNSWNVTLFGSLRAQWITTHKWEIKGTSMPQTPPSRARPEALIPPKGDPAARDFPFISTMPDRSKRARRFRRGPSAVWTCNKSKKWNANKATEAPHVVCEAVGRVIGDAHGVGFVVKGYDTQDGSKYFFFFNRHSRFHVSKYGGANEVAFGHAVGKSKTACKQPCALIDARLNVALRSVTFNNPTWLKITTENFARIKSRHSDAHRRFTITNTCATYLYLVPLLLAHHRANVPAAQVRWRDLRRLRHFFCNLNGAVVNAAFDKHARRGVATLTGVAGMIVTVNCLGCVLGFALEPEAISDAAGNCAFVGIGEDEICAFSA
jgi:hypothetical protein